MEIHKRDIVKHYLTEKEMSSSIENLKLAQEKLKLPKEIVIDSFKIYKKSIKHKLITRGVQYKTLLSAAIDVAIMKHKKIRRARELCEIFDINLIDLLKVSKKIELWLDISLPSKLTSHYLLAIRKIDSKLNLSGETVTETAALVEEAYEKGIKDETSVPAAANWVDIAAAALYIVSKKNRENVTLKRVSEITEIPEDLIIKRVIELYAKLNLKDRFSNK